MHPIVALAATQHGVVTTAQLLNAGVGRRSIARRVRAGWLVPLYRGVFHVGPTTSEWGREMAALLACGPDAALSHHSAAAVWGFARRDRVIHITVQGQGRRSRPGLRVHRTASLNAAVEMGLRVTRPHRTLTDLRRILTTAQYERALEQAEILGLMERQITADGFTRSDAEKLLKRLCRQAQLPMPKTNAIVAGYEVDAYWPEHNLIVEVDGYGTHKTRAAFERDRRKDAALTAAGHRVVRITWRRLTTEPIPLSAQFGALLRLA